MNITKQIKATLLATLLLGVGLSSSAKAYTEACFTDSNGNRYRGDIIETYVANGVDYADIHWMWINGVRDYQNRATALPFGSFYICGNDGYPTRAVIVWFPYARPYGVPYYTRYEVRYVYRGSVYREHYPEHRDHRAGDYHPPRRPNGGGRPSNGGRPSGGGHTGGTHGGGHGRPFQIY